MVSKCIWGFTGLLLGCLIALTFCRPRTAPPPMKPAVVESRSKGCKCWADYSAVQGGAVLVACCPCLPECCDCKPGAKCGRDCHCKDPRPPLGCPACAVRPSPVPSPSPPSAVPP